MCLTNAINQERLFFEYTICFVWMRWVKFSANLWNVALWGLRQQWRTQNIELFIDVIYKYNESGETQNSLL